MADLIASGRFANSDHAGMKFGDDGPIDFLWHKNLLAAERGIANAVQALLRPNETSSPGKQTKLRNAIAACAPEARKPNAEQVQGILNGLTEPISILTGPPGSGKTWSLSLLAAMVAEGAPVLKSSRAQAR